MQAAAARPIDRGAATAIGHLLLHCRPPSLTRVAPLARGQNRPRLLARACRALCAPSADAPASGGLMQR
eukprot:1715467-Alexandrium_andersonii.AAC.1